MIKTLLITGGSSGIGLATVQLFAERGWNVIELSRHGLSQSNVQHIDCDVTDEENVFEAVQQALKLTDHIALELNPDDIDERTKREQLIKKFDEFEKLHTFIASDKQCWVALHQKIANEVEGCRYVKLPNFNMLARWRRVFLYPLLLKIRNNEPEIKKDLKAITEDIKAMMSRMSNAAAESNNEVDDDF